MLSFDRLFSVLDNIPSVLGFELEVEGFAKDNIIVLRWCDPQFVEGGTVGGYMDLRLVEGGWAVSGNDDLLTSEKEVKAYLLSAVEETDNRAEDELIEDMEEEDEWGDDEDEDDDEWGDDEEDEDDEE